MGVNKSEIGGHADVRDTSLLLATAPHLVRMNKLTVGDGKNGVTGDARRASVAIGRALMDTTVARTVQEIRTSIAESRKR
jgi:creatinine amidohydrolase/Fe(II)-dependent formamide hydrolase-like protein